MPLQDHDDILLESLDSPAAMAEYLNEAIELGHEAYLNHALEIVRRKAGEGAKNSVAAAAELQRMLAPMHVAVRFEPMRIAA